MRHKRRIKLGVNTPKHINFSDGKVVFFKMQKSSKAIQAKVELKVKRTAITSLNNYYLNKINVPFWRTIQGKNFNNEQLVLALFKDMYTESSNPLWEKIKPWGWEHPQVLFITTAKSSLLLLVGARKHIKLGVRADWKVGG